MSIVPSGAVAPGTAVPPRAHRSVSPVGFWTFNRLLALIVIAGYAFLFLDVRYEHRTILGGEWEAWIPLLFAGTAVFVGTLTLFSWERGGRIAFAVLSGLAFVVGFLGAWHHTDGNLLKVFRILSVGNGASDRSAAPNEGGAASTSPRNEEENEQEEGGRGEEAQSVSGTDEQGVENSPGSVRENANKGGGDGENKTPLLAPLAFAGMGLLGLLAASRRFRAEESEIE